MSLDDAIRASFERSFALYDDFVAGLDDAALGSSLDPLPSNSIGAQLWCVVGARESYSRALAEGAWAGFSCSLGNPEDAGEVAAALGRSKDAVLVQLLRLTAFGDAHHRLLLDLLEHEAQHHGQLIRYLYGLRLPIPGSWNARYALD
jgi:hypothetical protein